MGEHDQDQDDVAEPARPPLNVAQAQEVEGGLREAMDDVRRSVAVLAARVRDAHADRVWASVSASSPSPTRRAPGGFGCLVGVGAPLGRPSWEAYCDVEFGIGIDLDHGLAARRYALSGDRRALHGTVL
jgi:hypothetical protein